MPFKCPVCGQPSKSLGRLAQHVFQLGSWHISRPHGKGAGMRIQHYNWLKERNITIMYRAVKGHLENLLRQGLIEEAH